MFVVAVAIVLVVAALGIGGFALINHYEIQPRRLPGSTALAVGDMKFTTEEFKNRTLLYSTQLGGYKVATYLIPAVDQQLQEEASSYQRLGEERLRHRRRNQDRDRHAARHHSHRPQLRPAPPGRAEEATG